MEYSMALGANAWECDFISVKSDNIDEKKFLVNKYIDPDNSKFHTIK